MPISESDFEEYGCENCGNKEGFYQMISTFVMVWVCSECGKGTIIARDGLQETPNGKVYPHPLAGKAFEESE